MGTSKYNLEQLGWFNFEQLTGILLRKLLGAGLSTFSGSADQGRDALFSGKANSYPSTQEPWDGNWIIQVKHRTYSSRSASVVRSELKRSLVKELKNITSKHKHNFDNYIYITNCPLTAHYKDAMLSIGKQAKIKNFAVLGENDLDQLLDGNPKVVNTFPQILGLSQLRDLVNWGLHQRSIEFLKTAQNEIATFVATSPYLKAIDLLHEQNFCILSGPPKMGKTCTAYALAASFATSSYEIWELREQKDFHAAYNAEEKQLFICDDVFGDIAINSSYRDDWARGLMRLLNSLGKNHKLIWTAREYILREAFSASKIKEDRPEILTTDKVTVSVNDLTRLEKAVILYNQAKEAKLSDSVKEYLKGDACVDIIDHYNYSPESIRQLCTGRLVQFFTDTQSDYGEIKNKINTFMAEPGESWKTAFNSASEGERILCVEVMASGGEIAHQELCELYEATVRDTNRKIDSFDDSMTNAAETFLKNSKSWSGDKVKFYHPSMRDLLVELIEDDAQLRIAYLKQLGLKDIAALFKPSDNSGMEMGSSEHRILINNEHDIDLMKDRLNTTLLPNSSLRDMLNLLLDIKGSIGGIEIELRIAERSYLYNELRESGEYPKIMWAILDIIIPHACSHDFWKDNSTYSYLPHWKELLGTLRLLLPVTKSSYPPIYVAELITQHRWEEEFEFWEMVYEAHTLVPTVVEQCIDLRLHENCRVYLENEVRTALAEAEGYDLGNNYDDSQNWYEEFGELNDKCDEYCRFFEEGIDKIDELEAILYDFPRLNEEPDEEYEPSEKTISKTDDDSDILEIFSDL